MKGLASVYERYEEQTEPKINLVIRAYNKIVDLLEEAAESIEKKDFENKANSISRAIDIITELMAALDFEQGKQIAVGLQNIYTFSLTQLMSCDMKNDARTLRKIAAIYKDLNTAWKEVAKQYYQKSINTNQGLSLNAGL